MSDGWDIRYEDYAPYIVDPPPSVEPAPTRFRPIEGEGVRLLSRIAREEQRHIETRRAAWAAAHQPPVPLRVRALRLAGSVMWDVTAFALGLIFAVPVLVGGFALLASLTPTMFLLLCLLAKD